jgi:hypothetical protein
LKNASPPVEKHKPLPANHLRLCVEELMSNFNTSFSTVSDTFSHDLFRADPCLSAQTNPVWVSAPSFSFHRFVKEPTSRNLAVHAVWHYMLFASGGSKLGANPDGLSFFF